MNDRQRKYLGTIFFNARRASQATQAMTEKESRINATDISKLENGVKFNGELMLFYIKNYFRPKDIIRLWKFDEWYDSDSMSEVMSEYKGVDSE